MISYGTFSQVDEYSGSADFKVGELLRGHEQEFHLPQLVPAYIAAVNAALPKGVELRGERGTEFFGPKPEVEVDFAAIVNGIDFAKVSEPYRR